MVSPSRRGAGLVARAPIRAYIGCSGGRSATSFDPDKAEYSGLDEDENVVLAARSEFPEASFEHLGSDLLFPHEDETFDLVFSVGLLGRHPDTAKRRLLSEMWRVSRAGGRRRALDARLSTM